MLFNTIIYVLKKFPQMKDQNFLQVSKKKESSLAFIRTNMVSEIISFGIVTCSMNLIHYFSLFFMPGFCDVLTKICFCLQNSSLTKEHRAAEQISLAAGH